MNVSLKILFEALKTLPTYSQCDKEEWVFLHASADSTKNRRLLFKKNHKTHSWDLII